jgi:MFS transporter, DHA2 family, multidrug resistance protein
LNEKHPDINKWLITMSVMIPTMIEILDTSVANVSLTHIQGSLSAGQEEVTWVLTSYLVANAIIIPMSGWFARILGRKRYLISSIILFTASSLLCGTATNLMELIFFRILQGVGGGGLQPMSQSILMETFPPEERGMALGIYGIGVVVGPILGPLLGGFLTDNYSWRWIFYINLPIGILAVMMCMNNIFDPPYQKRWQKGEKVDTIGIAFLCLGIGALQILLDKGQQEDWFQSQLIIILSCIAFISLVFLIIWELRQKSPILDLGIFRDRSFLAGNIIMFLAFFAFFGSIVLLPLYLQTLMGYSSFNAGLVLGPGGLLTLLMLPVVGKLTKSIDARFLLGIGLLILSFSVYYMSGFNLTMDFTTAVTGRIIQGLGMPMLFVTASYLTMAYVPLDHMNNATAIFSLLRNLGASFGVAFISTMVARRTQFHQLRITENLTQFDPGFMYRLQQLKTTLGVRLGTMTDHSQQALGIIYRGIRTQAAAMAFDDTFYVLTFIFLGLICVLFFVRRPPVGKAPGPVEH